MAKRGLTGVLLENINGFYNIHKIIGAYFFFQSDTNCKECQYNVHNGDNKTTLVFSAHCRKSRARCILFPSTSMSKKKKNTCHNFK